MDVFTRKALEQCSVCDICGKEYNNESITVVKTKRKRTFWVHNNCIGNIFIFNNYSNRKEGN